MNRHLLLVVLIWSMFGCAQFNDERYLAIDTDSDWEISEYKDWYFLSYQCETGTVGFNIQRALESDGSAYFVFFVVPIPPGELQNKEYRGIEAMVHYGETGIDCKDNAAKLTNTEGSYSPASIEYVDQRVTSCLMRWDYPPDKMGAVSLDFPRVQSCSIPPIKFMYKHGHRYKYESIQG